ncbi:uncharacterized protein OCT59_011097 [Rhizophagus irregularis]|uniref:uncharacterized protein n=1 Tax=Rhizophagus irregularis TaxID=588596 RepID=UPI00331D5A6B|nr:hypothetical protein OCT59_011097 [Rhizophagus irregularis]
MSCLVLTTVVQSTQSAAVVDLLTLLKLLVQSTQSAASASLGIYLLWRRHNFTLSTHLAVKL